MDDERWEPGMPVLDRQGLRASAADAALPASLRGQPPRSVPETAPTPLQKHYVLLSAPALLAGAVAITALELGVSLESPLVKACALVAVPLLLVTTTDATVRVWRSAWAWMPVDRGRGLFRLAWVVMSALFLVLVALAGVLVVVA